MKVKPFCHFEKIGFPPCLFPPPPLSSLRLPSLPSPPFGLVYQFYPRGGRGMRGLSWGMYCDTVDHLVNYKGIQAIHAVATGPPADKREGRRMRVRAELNWHSPLPFTSPFAIELHRCMAKDPKNLEKQLWWRGSGAAWIWTSVHTGCSEVEG